MAQSVRTFDQIILDFGFGDRLVNFLVVIDSFIVSVYDGEFAGDLGAFIDTELSKQKYQLNNFNKIKN